MSEQMIRRTLGPDVKYVLSYFTVSDEALHLAVSEDGYAFTPLNAGRPLVTSAVGSGAIRDPFLGYSADGAIHLLGTDGWRSPNIVHAVSEDLVTWSEPELLPVMAEVPGTQNAWAPEFFYDERTRMHHILWSSVVDPDLCRTTGDWTDPRAPQRIWTSATADFRSLGPARVFFDPGFSVIDATVSRDGDGYLMAFKDERESSELGGAHKNIHLARFDTVDGPIRVSPSRSSSLRSRGHRCSIVTGSGCCSSTDSCRAHTARSPAPTASPGARPPSIFRGACATARFSPCATIRDSLRGRRPCDQPRRCRPPAAEVPRNASLQKE